MARAIENMLVVKTPIDLLKNAIFASLFSLEHHSLMLPVFSTFFADCCSCTVNFTLNFYSGAL